MSLSIQLLQQKLSELADPEEAVRRARYFKTGPGEYGEGDRFRGIRVPTLRGVAREYRALPLPDSAGLLEARYHEDRLLALFILVDQFRTGKEATRTAIYNLYRAKTDRINNWDLVDCSAEHILGGYLLERDRSPLYELAGSKIVWERRMAIMATFHFIRQSRFKETLALAEVLLHDPDDLIHKAVGWMLREVGKRDRGTEEQFLEKHHLAMPRTMLRYAVEKFPETLRKSYLSR